MKKTFLILSSFAFVIIGILYSCNNIDNDKENSAEQFKNDPSLKNLVNNVEIYKSALNKKEINIIKSSLSDITKNSKNLEVKYGEKQVMAYFKILISQEKKENLENTNNALLKPIAGGDNCHRNDNGTVNADGCSGWEMISYVFSAAINCGSGEATNWYYNCCQAAVCRNC